MAENFLRIRTWDGVLMGHPPSMCVTWWSPRRGWSSCRRKHSKNLCRTITLKLQLMQNLKYWRLHYVVVVVFLFCDPRESFTNHCIFHIFSSLFLAVSLWDNPFLAGHNSQRGKSHFPCSWPLVYFVWHLFLTCLNTPSISGKVN